MVTESDQVWPVSPTHESSEPPDNQGYCIPLGPAITALVCGTEQFVINNKALYHDSERNWVFEDLLQKDMLTVVLTGDGHNPSGHIGMVDT